MNGVTPNGPAAAAGLTAGAQDAPTSRTTRAVHPDGDILVTVQRPAGARAGRAGCAGGAGRARLGACRSRSTATASGARSRCTLGNRPARLPGDQRLGAPVRSAAMRAARRRLVIASNRGPIVYGRSDGQRTARRGGGGLVTALSGLVASQDVTWVAAAISDEDDGGRGRARGQLRGDRPRRQPVPAAARAARPGRLRPLLQRVREPAAVVHPARAVEPAVRAGDERRDTRAAWESYRRVNEAFADGPGRRVRRAPTPCSSTTTSCTSCRGCCGPPACGRRSRTSRTSPGRARTPGGC